MASQIEEVLVRRMTQDMGGGVFHNDVQVFFRPTACVLGKQMKSVIPPDRIGVKDALEGFVPAILCAACRVCAFDAHYISEKESERAG